MPGLFLHKSRNFQPPIKYGVGPNVEVLKSAPLEKSFVNTIVAITELDVGAGRKSVRRPALLAAASASDPASDQISIVGVARVVAFVPIDRAWAEVSRNVEVAGYPFEPKVQRVDFWNLGKINSGVNRGTMRQQRRILIDHHRIRINLQPVSETRDAISEVEFRKPFARIRSGGCLV